VSNYISQDTVVQYAFLFAAVILAGWWAVKKFNYPWLNKFYISQMSIIYLVSMFYFSGAMTLLAK
jgi:hypothetical protein